MASNYRERTRQIDLIVEVGQAVDKLVRTPFTGFTLRMVGRPARMVELQDFLERGFAAFKSMGGALTFLHIIEQRERRIQENIIRGEPEPFNL